MLKKLLKYDLKDKAKFLLIFYGLSIFFAILTRLFLSIENSFIMDVIGKICSGATIAMIFNILINNLMRFWVRFKQNLYGDESYLTHTLPVTKKELYLSKIITAITSLFVSTLVMGLTLFIAYYSKENLEFVKSILLPITDIYEVSIIGLLIVFLFIFFLEFINIIQIGFTGIIIGHKMDSNKTIYSIIFGFIAYMVSQTFVLIVIFIVALFNKDMLNLFITNEMINIDMLKAVVYISIVIYTLMFIACYIINVKLFKKGVNVD